MNFWQDIKKPFLVLAPMEDVTDTVFRRIVCSCGRPDVLFTEFTNVDGICSVGKSHLIHRLRYHPIERPIVAQIWGMKPENYLKSAQLVVEMGFDGIDINMGCPEKRVIKQGACIKLIDNRNLANEIVLATKEGAGNLPISVKTRIGLNKIATEDWIGFLLKLNLDAITIHGRIAKEMSGVPAHWDEIGKVVALKDQMQIPTLVIGNGDVLSRKDALSKVEKFGVDGVMIGRGIFSNPWLFAGREGTAREKIEKMREHIELFDKEWGRDKNFPIMKKFFKMYIQGFPGASEMRAKFMEAESAKEALGMLG